MRLKRRGMAIGTGGIGKGYALDHAGENLRRAGIQNYMLFGGGQVQVHGRRGDRAWRVGIQHPRNAESYFAYLEETDASISTSGDYEHFFVDAQGKRWHHIIDPRTGLPADKAMSVTLVTDLGVYADALSTAVFVMGPERGIEMLSHLPFHAEATIVGADLRLVTTPGTREHLVMRVELEYDNCLRDAARRRLRPLDALRVGLRRDAPRLGSEGQAPRGMARRDRRGALGAARLGVFALRWFVLADGTNAGVGPASAANESRWGGAAPTWDARARRWRFELRALPGRVRRGLRGPARGARARRARAAAVARRNRLVRGRRRQRGRRGRARQSARQGSSLGRCSGASRRARARPRRGARAAARRRRAPPTRDARIGEIVNEPEWVTSR